MTAAGLAVIVTAGVAYVVSAPAGPDTLAGAAQRSSMPSDLPTVTASVVRPDGAQPTPRATVGNGPTGRPTGRATVRTTVGSSPRPRATAPRTTLGPLRPAAYPPSVLLPAPATLDFRISSFNMLGASHTSATGKRPEMASGRVRALLAARLIRRHGAEVVGFQELQRSQLTALERATAMDFYPGSTGDSENSIGWDRATWVAVERHTVAIPYFDGGLRQMPFVRLRNRATGIEAWFANFHNPAETARYHRQRRYRVEASRIESALANRLITTTRLPVFITGDMNERGAYFCRLTGTAPMIAARGGTNNGHCRPDDPRTIDWIFGSQGVEFTGYVEDHGPLVRRATDHPVVTASVHLVGAAPPPAAGD